MTFKSALKLLFRRLDPHSPEYRTIAASGLFDAKYYLREHREVAEAGEDPLAHFCREGWRKGFDPSPSFSVTSYLARNRDVKDAGVNPLLHYVRFGLKQPWRMLPPQAFRAPRAVVSLERSSAPSVLSVCELQRVPAPLMDEPMSDVLIADVATNVRKALYEAQ